MVPTVAKGAGRGGEPNKANKPPRGGARRAPMAAGKARLLDGTGDPQRGALRDGRLWAAGGRV